MILVAPVWKGQPWCPVLLEMLYDYPQQLPRMSSLFQQTFNASQMNLLPQLAVWLISDKKFGHGDLSESAKELILASWRSKTSRAYDSHFKKWSGWCTEWGFYPVSGPITDVVSFLADLHGREYQTSYFNAYRSTI